MKSLKSKLDKIYSSLDKAWFRLERIAESFYDEFLKDEDSEEDLEDLTEEYGEPGVEKIRRVRPEKERGPYSDKYKPRTKKHFEL